MTYQLVNEDYMLAQAMQAIKDILSNTEEVTMGNGVDNEGRMYSDVKMGLSLAGLFLQGIKEMKEKEQNV